MSAAVIVDGLLEGLELVTNLAQAQGAVSSAIQQAQASGTPFDLSAVIAAEQNAENKVLAAIADAKARGR